MVSHVAGVQLHHRLVPERGVRAPDTDDQRDGRDEKRRQGQGEDETVAMSPTEPALPVARRRKRAAAPGD